MKEFIVLNCLPIVKIIARSIARRSTDPVEDIIQIGCVGLVKAIDLYKPIYNKHFEAYAKIFIAGEIKHYLRDNTELIKSSRAIRELSYKINKIINELTEKLGHEPSDEEIAEALQIMPAQVKECVEQNRRTTFVSIDNNDSNEDCTYSLAEKIEDESAKRTILSYENKMLLDDIISQLGPLEQDLITSYYYDELTVTELTLRYGISSRQITQKLKNALDFIAKTLSENGFDSLE